LEKRTIKGVDHYVFENVKEFTEYYHSKMMNSPEVKGNWREGNEGDWVYSDDNRIVQLLKVSKNVNHPGDRKNYKYANGWVRTVVGSFLNRHTVKMDTDFSSHPNRYTFSKTIKDTNKRIKERKKVTNKEKMFATNIVVGMGAVDAYKKAYNEMSSNKAGKKAAILLKQERVMKEIEKSVLDVAKGLGIDHEYILNKLKHLADYSEDDNIILQSTKELGKIVGTSGNNVKQIETGIVGMFKGFGNEDVQIAGRKEIPSNSNVEEEE